MTSRGPETRPLWRGRALAVLGIVLVAFSLRSAVASLSPVVDHVARDFPMPSAVGGLIGTAPPVGFALLRLRREPFEADRMKVDYTEDLWNSGAAPPATERQFALL